MRPDFVANFGFTPAFDITKLGAVETSWDT